MKKLFTTKWHFGTMLTGLITISTVLIIFFISMYYDKYISKLSDDYDNNLKVYVSTLIFGSYAYDFHENNFTNTTRIINDLKKHNIIKYVYVFNQDTKDIIWASNNIWLNFKAPELQNYLTHQDYHDKVIETVNNAPKYHYTIVIGNIRNAMMPTKYNPLFINSGLFFLISLIIGFLASCAISYFMMKQVKSLRTGASEYTKRNFDYRFEESIFKEFNDIALSFNQMSDELQNLYKSLESKVQERTKELEETNKELKKTQAMMVHSEKMRSLGELVAGIAHEINNPINFIYGNMIHLENYANSLLKLINMYENTEEFIPDDKKSEITQEKEDMDLEFLTDDIKNLIRSCKEGTERTKNIVLDLKNFSRLEEMVVAQIDLPKEIDTTLNILNNKIKNRITVVKNYDENIPKIEAYGGQLNQVFMNIIDNAQGAIQGNGEITIDIHKVDDKVVIKFKDTGCGIDKESLTRVFDPFYTTKPVGSGTGLGMSIAYQVIQNHHGTINVESEVGKGTTFIVTLPVSFSGENNG